MNGHGFIIFGKSAACAAEIKAGTTVLVFRRIYGCELSPVVHDSLDLLGFCLGPWEEEHGLGPCPKITVRLLEGGDGRAPRSAGIPDATPAKTTGSQSAAQKEGSTSTGEGSVQLECVPGSQMGANRTLVERCCGEDSLLGVRTESSRACKVYRFTEKVDMTKPEVVKGCESLLRGGT